MKQFTFLIALIFCIPLINIAQESPKPSLQPQIGNMSLSFLHLRPLEDLALNGYQEGWGASMEWLSNDLGKNAPINIQTGIRIDATHNGRYRTDVQLTEPLDANARYRLSNSQFGIGGLVRFITRDAPVRLYTDVTGSFRSFSTTESYDLIGAFPGYENYTSDAVLTKWNVNYGGAAGIQVRLAEDVSLDIRGLYNRGTQARFADLGSVTKIENNLSYTTNESSSAQWGFQIGFSFKLYEDGCDNDCCCCDD